jgi:hypothetical protein
MKRGGTAPRWLGEGSGGGRGRAWSAAGALGACVDWGGGLFPSSAVGEKDVRFLREEDASLESFTELSLLKKLFYYRV